MTIAEELRQYAQVGSSLDLPSPKRTALAAADLIDSLEEQLEAALRKADEWPAALHHRIDALTRERDHLLGRLESRYACEAATQARAGAATILNESLVEQLEAARKELASRRGCLVAARVDFSAIAGASVEDGGIWIRSVAQGRIPYLDQAIANTDAALGEDLPTEGLPADLARVLRDHSIIVPQDQSVFELIASWANAPSDTASAIAHTIADDYAEFERGRASGEFASFARCPECQAATVGLAPPYAINHYDGCANSNPAGVPDTGNCADCGRPLTTQEAIRSDACPDCDPASAPEIADMNCECGGCQRGEHHFDRSLCACGAMHYYCDECGFQCDDCDPASEPKEDA